MPVLNDVRYNKLKPCPFCGGKAVIDQHEIPGYAGCYSVEISCGGCCAMSLGLPTDSIYRSLREATKNAIRNWNGRHDDAEG